MTELMGVFVAADLEALPQFSQRQDQLAIVERQAPEEASPFFQKLMETPLRITGQVRKDHAENDIRNILGQEIPQELQDDVFYGRWVEDMAEVSKSFCNVQNSEAVGFCLSTERGCRRYHTDNVPLRALVTYAGQGTEWLPDEAADRSAFANGEPNEKIVKDPSAIQFMRTWDVSVFRGGAKGLLHRTPDAALNSPSILLRLDHSSFWDNILKQQQENSLN